MTDVRRSWMIFGLLVVALALAWTGDAAFDHGQGRISPALAYSVDALVALFWLAWFASK